MKEPTLLVHPDDVNLADIKALAAEHGASVVPAPHIPRGQGFLVDAALLNFGQPS